MHDQNTEYQVRQYYDFNSKKFFWFLKRSVPKTIHQALFASDEMSLEDALHTPHRLILDKLPDSTTRCHILDLGCGLGESMIYLAQHTTPNTNFVGITLSGKQTSIATDRISSIGLQNRIQVIEGSFQSIPGTIQRIDVGYAIESLIHSPDPAVFFSQVESVMNRGSRLIIFDDFLRKQPGESDHTTISDFKKGWLANTLLTPDKVIGIATQSGLQLESHTDLSKMLRLRRTRDKFIHMISPFARVFMKHSQYFRFLVGGDARQQAYVKGLLEYNMLVFVKL